MVKYSYDAWGNCKVLNASGAEITDANHIGNLNPFRYRSYYYDTETKLYYLQSRYYDPEIGRFITIDDISYLDPDAINGLNLYAYCLNNPVMNIDPSGHFGLLALLGIGIASLLIGGGAQLVSNAMAGQTGSELWRGVAGAAIGTAVNALMLCGLPVDGAAFVLAAGTGALTQTGIDMIETTIRGEDINMKLTVQDLAINFVTTLVGNVIGSMMIPINSGWFQPKKFFSVFTKTYGQRILLQTGVGAALSGVVNYFRKIDYRKINYMYIKPLMPVRLF